MERRRLGRTGLQVSTIGLGSRGLVKNIMNFGNAEKIINYALDNGINFIETARTYGNAEEKIGRVMKKRRGDCYIISKTPNRTKEGALKDIDISLDKLQTNKIDIYQLHYVISDSDLERVLAPDGALQGLKKAKMDGKIDFIGITTHLAGIAIKAMKTNEFDTIQIPYNPMEVDFFSNAISLANEMDIGIIAMMALAVGAIKDVDTALRFVYAKNISTVTIGMGSIKHIKYNIQAANTIRELSPYEGKTFLNRFEKFNKYFCRECSDCESICPVHIPIAYIFMMERYLDFYKNAYRVKDQYRSLKEKANICTTCKACEKICPYGLKISEMLKLAHNRLITKDKGILKRFFMAPYKLMKFFSKKKNIKKVVYFIFIVFKPPLISRVFNIVKTLVKERSIKESYIAIFPEIDTRISFLNSLPPMLQIECTTKCNLRCKMCEHTYWQGEEKDLSFEKFKEIIDQFPNLYKVRMLGFGENFLNKDFLKMLKYLKSRKIKVWFIDNFTLITKECAQELIELGIDQICISIERTTKELYEKTRIGASFDKVMQNIKNLVELKKEFKRTKPELIIYTSVSNDNLYEIDPLVNLASNLGIKEIRFCQEYTFSNYNTQFDKSLFLNRLRDVSKKAKYHNIKLSTLFIDRLISDCWVPWVPFVSVDGVVMPICHYFRSRGRLVEFGNIFEKNFKEIWNSRDYRGYRRLIRKGKASYVCTGTGCMETSAFWKAGLKEIRRIAWNENL